MPTSSAKRGASSQSYDLIVAEYPSAGPQATRTMELLRQTSKAMPIIFVMDTLSVENRNGVRKEWRPRLHRDGSHRTSSHGCSLGSGRKATSGRSAIKPKKSSPRHSKAHYRALVESSAYGMCRCSKDGAFLDVNHVLVAMLGYDSEEFSSARFASDIIQDPVKRALLLERSLQTGRVEPLETDWKRKDGTTLRVRLSGRKVRGEKGALDGYGIIVEDVTDQRALEDQLRKPAASDGLTGLANYRQLVDVLDSEAAVQAHRTRIHSPVPGLGRIKANQ